MELPRRWKLADVWQPGFLRRENRWRKWLRRSVPVCHLPVVGSRPGDTAGCGRCVPNLTQGASRSCRTGRTGRSDGLPVSITSPDPDGAGSLGAYETELAYDSYGRLTTTTFPDASTQVLAYNSADMVTSVVNENGDETVYAYDALNRLTSITGEDPDAGGGQSSPVTSFTYDPANNLLTQVDALSQTTAYDYDERNRMIEVTMPDPDAGGSLPAPNTTYDYDGVGNLIGEGLVYMADAISHEYDPYGRLIETTFGNIGGGSDHKEEDWEYDVLGRLTKYTNSWPRGSSQQDETYTYDSRGRVLTHTGHDPDYTGPGVGPITTYTYNYAGQPASVTDPLGFTTSYTYTTAGWLNSVTLPDPDGSGSLYSPIYTLGYDALAIIYQRPTPTIIFRKSPGTSAGGWKAKPEPILMAREVPLLP